MNEIRFNNGSVIYWPKPKEGMVIRGMNSKNIEFGNHEPEERFKLTDESGNVQADLPANSELLNAIVGYPHDPRTHNYNRAERRRIIKAAKELERKAKKRG